MINRRRFIQSIAAAATAPAVSQSCRANDGRFGPLCPDPDKILDLPAEFRLRVIARVGQRMSDVLRVPGAHDGMAAFPGDNRRIINSLFHRYIPSTPGKLGEGGKLQALALPGQATLMTHNWSAVPQTPLDKPLQTRWIDLDDVDPAENNLRLRGAAKGAATFTRGEGLCLAGDRYAFTCTNAGRSRLGQVFTYTPSPFEGTSRGHEAPGELTLIAEADENSLLRNADNLTMAPWGDLIVCEDTANHCGLVGIRPDDSQ